MVKSERGNNMAAHQGFRFMKHQKNEDGTKQYWKCDKANGGNGAKCKAKLHTQVPGNLFLKFVPHDSINSHNHKVDPMALTVSRIKENIKQRAIDTREKPQQLLNHELQSAPVAVASCLSKSAIRKQVRRIRIKNQIPVLEARRVEHVNIPAASQSYETKLPSVIRSCLSWVIQGLKLKTRNGTLMDPPMFPVNMWSCYERTLVGEDRTNNYAEAAYRRLQDALGVEHPTVGRLLQDFKRIQRTHDFNYEQYLAGIAAPKKRRVYRESDARILGRVRRYHQTNIVEYLRGLAHNFVMDQ